MAKEDKMEIIKEATQEVYDVNYCLCDNNNDTDDCGGFDPTTA